MNDLYAVVEGRFGVVEVRTISHNLSNHAHANLHMQFSYWMGGGTAHVQIGNERANYSDDYVVGINRYESHDFSLDDPNSPAIILELSLQLSWLYEVQSGLDQPVLHAMQSIASSPEIQQAAFQLMQNTLAPHLQDAQAIESSVINLVRLTLGRTVQRLRPVVLPLRRKLIDYRLRLALAYMQDPAVTVHSINDVAKHVGLSRSRLYELFQRELNSSPQVTWKSIRMQRAVHIVGVGGEDLAEVATKLGFSSAGNFSRYFRGVMGVTPSAYRKAALKKRFNDSR
jgi:AraC-like DNA-binding protein